jgi:uncharacterized membrane protein
MRNPLVAGSLVAAAVLACGDSTLPPEPITSLRMEGRVLDPAGAPVAGAFAVLHLWLSSEDPDPGFRTHDAVASDGSFAAGVDGLDGALIDSVGLEAVAPGCLRVASMKVIRGDDLPEGPQATLTEDLTVGPVPAVPTSGVEQVCASGAEPFWGVGSYSLAMRFDVIDGELVQGRWSVSYLRATVGPDGTFEGVQRDGILALVLTPNAFPGCTELRLTIPVSQAGVWGSASVAADDGCLPVAEDLTFAVLDDPGISRKGPDRPDRPDRPVRGSRSSLAALGMTSVREIGWGAPRRVRTMPRCPLAFPPRRAERYGHAATRHAVDRQPGPEPSRRRQPLRARQRRVRRDSSSPGHPPGRHRRAWRAPAAGARRFRRRPCALLPRQHLPWRG